MDIVHRVNSDVKTTCYSLKIVTNVTKAEGSELSFFHRLKTPFI